MGIFNFSNLVRKNFFQPENFPSGIAGGCEVNREVGVNVAVELLDIFHPVLFLFLLFKSLIRDQIDFGVGFEAQKIELEHNTLRQVTFLPPESSVVSSFGKVLIIYHELVKLIINNKIVFLYHGRISKGEELLASRQNRMTKKTSVPFGYFFFGRLRSKSDILFWTIYLKIFW